MTTLENILSISFAIMHEWVSTGFVFLTYKPLTHRLVSLIQEYIDSGYWSIAHSNSQTLHGQMERVKGYIYSEWSI